MKAANAYLEAKRYVDNARKMLSSSAGKDGDYYSDPKYVKMAGSTAYTGVLLALGARFGLKEKNGKRLDVKHYIEAIAKVNKHYLKEFNSAYNYLHLYCGYDGDLKVTTSQTGLALADKLIEWTKSYSEKVTNF